MSRFVRWVERQYYIYQRNKYTRARQQALQIIPPDASPYEVMQAWKTEMIRRHGFDGFHNHHAATPSVHAFTFVSFLRRAHNRLRRIVYAIFS